MRHLQFMKAPTTTRRISSWNEQLPKVEITRELVAEEWQGDWFFNTNETHAPGAYSKMFCQQVVAIYGYHNGPENLQAAAEGRGFSRT